MATATVYAGSGAAVASAAEEEELITHATHFGPLEAYVKGGKFYKLRPHPMVGKTTEMLDSLVEYVNTPNRIKNPCVRKSFLEGRNEPHRRGAEEFVDVSWETALDLVAAKLEDAKRFGGSESIFRSSFAGWATSGTINRPNILQGRFLGLFGGFTDTVGDYSAGAARQIIPHIMGGLEIYSRKTAYEVIRSNTKTIVLWGMDPLKNFRIDYGVYDHKKTDWYYDLKHAGINFVCIDPVYNDTARELGAEWTPIRPSTDTAMILGICGYLYKTGKYSKKFINKYTVGFDMFKDYITGKTDGIEKTPEWAERICGVSASKIVSLTELMLKDDTLISTLYGAQRHEYGEQFHWCLVVMACMLGHIGTPGGGIHLGAGWLASSGEKMPRRLSQGRNPARAVIPASRLGEMLLNPGRTIDFNGSKLTYPNINLIYCSGANALSHHQDTNQLLRGIRRIDTMITHEIYWNPWAKISDIVLLATTTFEKNDIGLSYEYNIRYIWAMKQVVKPLHNAKSDYWIYSQLAKKLGFEEEFTQGRSNMDWVRWSYESAKLDTPFEEFWEKGFLKFDKPEKDKEFVYLQDYIENPKNNPLFTPSGKIEIYSEKVASFGYKDCKGHPVWFEPKEWLGSTRAQKNKFHLLSIHSKHRLHSQLDNLPIKDLYKVNGREPVTLNPRDAEELGVKEGDNVEIFNLRGAIICGVVISENIMPKVARVDEGAWYAPENPGEIGTRCLNGNANVLTSSRPTSKLAQACAAHSCLVSIRKLDGEVKSNTAYDNPKIITSKL